MDKTIRNELISELADINEIIETLESRTLSNKEATDSVNQLLYAHDIKLKILKYLYNC